MKLGLRELLDDISIAPFLAEKRLVVIDGIPKFKKAEIDSLIAQIHPSTVLVLIDSKTGSKSTAAKDWTAEAIVKTFPAQRGPALRQWILERAALSGVTLQSAAAEKLILLLQGDQQFIDQEIQKLSQFRSNGTVTVRDVEEMVVPLEGALWSVTDAIVSGHPKKAVEEAARLHRAGIDAPALWNMILSFLRQVTLVSAAIAAGEGGPSLASKIGIHPFALRSLQPYAKKLHPKQLRAVIDRACSLERDLKTGGLRMSDDAPEEMLSAVDSLLLRFP